MNSDRFQGSSQEKGVSLLELLVAVTISSVIIVLLSSLLLTSLNQWNRQTGRMQNNVEAHVALDMLVDDLRSVVLKEGKSEWLHIRTREVAGVGEVTDLLLLGRPIDNRATRGDVAAIAYRIEKRAPFPGGDPLHGLYRTVLSPEETIDYLGAENLYEEIWKNRASLSTDDLVCSYVVELDLDVVFLVPDGTFHRLNSTRELRCSHFATLESAELSTIPPGSQVFGVDMRLTVVDRFAQNLLNQDEVNLEEFVARHGYTYTSTVDFSSRAL